MAQPNHKPSRFRRFVGRIRPTKRASDDMDANPALSVEPQEPGQPPKIFVRRATGDLNSTQEGPLREFSGPTESSFYPYSTSHVLNDPEHTAGNHPSDMADSPSGRPSSYHARTIDIDPGYPEASSDGGSEFEDEEDWSKLLQIKCELEVGLNDEEPVLLPDKPELKVKWYDASAWEEFDKRAGDWLASKGVERGQWSFPILRHGSFRIIGKHHESLPRKLFDRKHLPEVLVGAVTRFIGEHLREPFHLRVRWDFDSIQIAPRQGDSYDNIIRNEVTRREHRNFKGEPFFSSYVLNRILPEDAVKIILAEDKNLNLNAEALEMFRKRLRDCRRLQTLCIWQRIPMRVLKGILDANLDLDDIKIKNLHSLDEISNGDLDKDTKDWKDFMEYLPAFHPYQFPSPANVKKTGAIGTSSEEGVDIPEHVVVPICHIGGKDAKETIIGEGGFSKVLAVKIEPSYQVYTQDKNQIFALKCFKRENTKRKAHYEKERRVLEKLKRLQTAPQKQHLVTHFAAWSQGSEFFILFPMATGNLEDFMNYLPCPRVTEQPKYGLRFDLACMKYDEDTKLPILDNKFVRWLFTQLKGLADALDHLHHLVRNEDESQSHTLKLPGQSKSNQVTGYHHDIKPDNILVFVDDKSSYGTMKLGDFGSANITETDQNLYQKSPIYTEKMRGAMTYSSPDLYCDNKMTRKADIWTLGCVFLEIMIWCLEERRPGFKSFTIERQEESQPDPRANFQIDDYWKWDQNADGTNTKKPVLKDAVKNKLQDVRKKCEAPNMVTFLAVHRLITQMLSPGSAKRIPSQTLTKELDYLCVNVEANLRRKDFYCGPLDPSKVKNNSPYLDMPPSPSSDARSYVRTRSRSRSPRGLDLEAGTSELALSPGKRGLRDLEQTDGQWASQLEESNTKDDVLSTGQPADVLLRGRERSFLGAADFTMKRRSASGQRAAVLRRHMSDPTTEVSHTPWQDQSGSGNPT